MSKKEEIMYRPPASVAKNAEKGLKFREQFERGGTEVGINRAHQLKAREKLPLAEVKKIYSYFSRHTVDKNADDFGNEQDPSKGYIAWLLWGGDAGFDWVKEVLGK